MRPLGAIMSQNTYKTKENEDVELIFAAADGKNHAKITQICHSGGCNNMEMLMFWVPKLDY